ncbi:MAG TPA: hypothetical protein VGR71_05920, partial [Nitrospira sp.]|nr:hypothetical protein [Nitrospira sp.]
VVASTRCLGSGGHSRLYHRLCACVIVNLSTIRLVTVSKTMVNKNPGAACHWKGNLPSKQG